MTQNQRMQKRRSFISLLALCLLISACVSVNIGPKKATRSEKVSFREPQSPFQALSGTKADHAWQNKGNGNSISYFSTCNDPSDPPLDAVQREMFSDIENQTVLKNEARNFNGREALMSEIEGLVDGVKTRIDLMVFKKNDCIYSISYVGVAKSFAQDMSAFTQFLENFRAP